MKITDLRNGNVIHGRIITANHDFSIGSEHAEVILDTGYLVEILFEELRLLKVPPESEEPQGSSPDSGMSNKEKVGNG